MVCFTPSIGTLLPGRSVHTAVSPCRPRALRDAIWAYGVFRPSFVRPSIAEPRSAVTCSLASPSDSAVFYTSYESNSYVLNYASKRILVDPWLVSTLDLLHPLLFSSAKPLLSTRTLSDFLSEPIDAILISQSLPDHLHVPTLAALPKSIPLITSTNAYQPCKDLGFASVTALPHNATVAPFGPDVPIRLTATVGSVAGPPWKTPENGWLFAFGSGPETRRLYTEPHGTHPPELLNGALGTIHGVISPVVRFQIDLAGGYTLVQGADKALELCRRLRPEVCVVLMNHVTDMRGALTGVLRAEGSVQRFRERAQEEGLTNLRIVEPPSMEPVELLRVPQASQPAEVSTA